MKRYTTTLFLFGLYFLLHAQIKTIPGNCNDDVLMSIKGNWKQKPDNIYNSNFSRDKVAEALSRMSAMHKLMLEAYPQPTGNDGNWWRNLTTGSFANYIHNNNSIPICAYSYYCALGYFSCMAYHPHEVQVVGGETSTWLRVFANDFGELSESLLSDTMSVNGLRVYRINPVIGTWKGYPLIECGGNSRAVLLTRQGELPYIPVTRKQYLDICVRWISHLFDETIKIFKELPLVENNETEKKIREENIAAQQKMKEDNLKRYGKELEKTTAAGLLDSPAIVLQTHPVSEDWPVFSTEEGGKMLVTDNPNYIKRDLPKYVPQFIVLYWSWNASETDGFAGGAQGRYYRKMMEANFPIEKLQEMIDK